MTVKQLRELLIDADDNLFVMCYGLDGYGFVPSEVNSGVVLMTEPCDEFGNPIEDDRELKLFALFDDEGIETK